MAQDFELQLTPVASSNIEAVGYVAASAQLFVRFRNGGIYEYAGVPPEVHQALLAAPSKGSYLHREIKPKYTAPKLAQEPVTRDAGAAVSPEQSTEPYTDRNLLAQLVAWVGVRHGWPVYCMTDPAEPDWPVLGIELPNEGQITFHIPRDEVIVRMPERANCWDGHTTEEKRARIRRFLAEGG